jgi:branched-chain amino acid transport system ATP-binding protein
MLAIARALMSAPKLLMLDEPSSGLSPIMASVVFGAIRDLKKAGMTLLLVEQRVKDALAVSDFVYVLEGGRVVDSGTPGAIAEEGRLARGYFGLDSVLGLHRSEGQNVDRSES